MKPPSKQLQERMQADGFPPEQLEPLAKLWKIRQHVSVRILPKDAWIVVGLLQFADRNPNIEDSHHEALRWFAGELIAALINIEPRLEPYIMAGWDASKDVPIEKKKEV